MGAKTKSLGILSFTFLLSFQVFAEDMSPPALEADAKSRAAFEVKDLPKPEPIEGQLGEPGAPDLKEEQSRLAKSLLEKGICNANYFGEEFCAKQAKLKTFRVTDQFGSTLPKSQATSQE